MEFKKPPPLSSLTPVVTSSSNLDKLEILQEQFNSLIEKGALEPIPPSTGPVFFSRIFVVPKKSGGVCPIIYLKALNGFLTTKLFKMELTESIRAAHLLGMWTYSIDLKDANFYIPVQSRKFYEVPSGGRHSSSKPFLSDSALPPWLFTMVAREVSLAHPQLEYSPASVSGQLLRPAHVQGTLCLT